MKAGVRTGIVLLQLLAGVSGIFLEAWNQLPNARVSADRYSANITLFSGYSDELSQHFEITFSRNVGRPRFCAEKTICVRWALAQLFVIKGQGIQRKVTIRSQKVAIDVRFSLDGSHLYGGPVMSRYPSQKITLKDYPYVTYDKLQKGVTGNTLERYWFTTNGLALHVDPDVPLFISQNTKELRLIARSQAPYANSTPTKMSFTICDETNNARDAVRCIFPTFDKPIPPMELISFPIWSTWVEYKRTIDQSKVLQFESDIRKYGMNASIIEIDDHWESCYGSQTFNSDKFPDPKGMIEQLHSFGRLVTLWVHPFLGPGCPPELTESYKQYLFTLPNGTVATASWFSGIGNLFNFLDSDTAKWYGDRLRSLKNMTQVDGYKFDYGEAGYMQGLLNGSLSIQQPNRFTTNFVTVAAEFGPLIEVRVGAETTQLKVMQRLQDRNSLWDTDNNGIRSVISSVLQLSLIGYGAILPDMIGGNQYAENPSKELFIRWVQLNTFLPLMQFSKVPWSYDEETINITKKFTSMHYDYRDRFMKEFNSSLNPVINPIWWLAPNDKIAQVISSEFLVGEDLLVAPVVREGAVSRDIYLPVGTWRDENTGNIHKGPITLKNYPAPLTVLPYFERINIVTPFK